MAEGASEALATDTASNRPRHEPAREDAVHDRQLPARSHALTLFVRHVGRGRRARSHLVSDGHPLLALGGPQRFELLDRLRGLLHSGIVASKVDGRSWTGHRCGMRRKNSHKKAEPEADGITLRLTKEETDEIRRIVGTMIFNLPFASDMLGHTSCRATIIGNYLAFSGSESKVERLAKEFVNDLFKMSTPQMCVKWYGETTDLSYKQDS